MRKMTTIFSSVGWYVLFFGVAASCSAQEIYTRTQIDDHKNLHVYTRAGKDIVFQKDPGIAEDENSVQVGFADIQLSEDGHAVGWLSLYPNCCTSYPVPLGLQVYRDGKLYSFKGTGLPVWDWSFVAKGEGVVFHQETVHGGLGIHYEMRDIKTNRLLKQFDPLSDKQSPIDDDEKLPNWVEDFQKTIDKK